jgi:mannitol-1-/sugar-/sorbitol-6-phosphatase
VTVLHAEGLLFDSDGVLVDSDSSVEEAWTTWARHWDLDPEEVVAQVHGTPSRRTVARLIAEPHREEALVMVDRLELESADAVRALPGAVELLASLVPGTWSVVTSGTGPLARARLRAAGIPLPEVLVTADDVTRGKPDPEPYRTAAGRLGRAPGVCLVFEDAAPGVAAARAAGVRHVVGVTRRHLEVDAYVPDLRSVTVDGRTVRLTD